MIDSVTPSHSVGVSCAFFCNKVGVLRACFGVDVQVARPTPIGKRFGVDVGADNDVTLACALFLDSLGFSKPYVEPIGQRVAIGHDPKDGVVIFGTISEGSNG